jgi:peptidoglycan hydrolase-like protein with peptidoglycan-binding domain
LRNAAARLDDEFGFGQPVSKSKPRPKSATAKSKKKTAGRPKKNKTRYVHYAAVGLTAALTLGIVINALSLQNSRHPAPLFGKAIQLGDQSAPMTASLEAPVAPAPAPATGTAAVNPAAAEATANHDNPAPAAHPHHTVMDPAAPARHAKLEKGDKGDDPIAALLKTSAASAPAEKPKDDPKTVLATQHALLKLGYVVAPNGTFGAATRTALQAFEREQHLPISGELSRKLLKQLSTESGVAID